MENLLQEFLYLNEWVNNAKIEHLHLPSALIMYKFMMSVVFLRLVQSG